MQLQPESRTTEVESKQTEHRLHVESLLDDVRAAAKHDEQYQLLLKGEEKHDMLQRRDGLVYSRSGAVYVPNERRLKNETAGAGARCGWALRPSQDDRAPAPALLLVEYDQRGRGLPAQLRGVLCEQELESADSRSAEAAADNQSVCGTAWEWTSLVRCR